MPRVRFDNLPPAERARLYRIGGGRGIVSLVRDVRAAGYDPAGVPMPATAMFTTIAAELGRDAANAWARGEYVEALQEELKAQKLIDASRTWAATTSAEDDQRRAEQERRDREAAAKAHERAIAARAKELLAADATATTARARARAESELSR